MNEGFRAENKNLIINLLTKYINKMKKLVLLTFVLYMGIMAQAQNDVIYPAEGGQIISNCRIDEVRSANEVYYTKDGMQSHIRAVAISQDGVYISLAGNMNGVTPKVTEQPQERGGLYRGHDYSYYSQLRRGALAKRNTGIVFTFLGLGACVAGSMMLIDNPNDEAGAGLYIGGAVIGDIGIVLWIAGGIKAANNRKAMEQCHNNLKLSFGPTQNGVGLKLALR